MNFFLPYQIQWINSPHRYPICLKSRQCGYTFAEAFWSFRRRLNKKIDHIFCSANLRTSKEFIGYVKKFAEATNIVLNYEIIDKNNFQSESVIFPLGGRIILVSSNPVALRGFKADCTLDEFAFHDNQAELFMAAQPVCTWGGANLRIISTHNGEGTIFNEILKKAELKQNNFHIFKTTLKDAVDQGLCEKIEGDHRKIKNQTERRKAYIEHVRMSCLSDLMFDQEFDCKVLSPSSIISPEQYDKCIVKDWKISRDIIDWDISASGPIYVGIDPARFNDLTVITFLEQGTNYKEANPKLQRSYRIKLVKTIKNMPFDAQYSLISGLIKSPQVKRVLIEKNGVGMGLSEQLENNFMGKCLGWTSTASTKANAIEKLAGFIAQERISLPEDPELREDILSMQRVTSSTGRIGYDGKSQIGHCDFFISLALSLSAGENEQEYFEYVKV